MKLHFDPIPSVVALLAALFLTAALPEAAFADTIILRNGNEIQGEIVEETAQKLTVRFPGGTLVIARRDITSIQRQARLDYLLQAGEASLRREDAAVAEDLFRAARRADAASEPAKRGLESALEKRAALLARQDLHRDALEAYEKLLGEFPASPRAHEAMAQVRAAAANALREEREGRESLDAGDAEKALTTLQRVADRYPDRRVAVAAPLARAFAARGETMLAAGKFAEAETQFLEAASLDPDLLPRVAGAYAHSRAQRIVRLLDESNPRGVVELADEGLRLLPSCDVLHYLRGVGLETLKRERDAREAYLRVEGVAPPKDPKTPTIALRGAAEAILARRMGQRPSPETDTRRQEVLPGGFRNLETDHFVVRHNNAIVANDVGRAAEDAYARIRSEIGFETDWPRPCTITVHPDHDEFRRGAGKLAWSGGYHRIERRLGALADHTIASYQTQPRLTQAIIPHEVAHAVLAQRVGYRHAIPLWFNEGFAIHWEPTFVHRHYNRVAAHALRTRTAIPLRELLAMRDYPASEEQVKVFYALSHALVDLLCDERKLGVAMDFVGDLALAPDSIEVALLKHYKLRSLKELEGRLALRLSQ